MREPSSESCWERDNATGVKCGKHQPPQSLSFYAASGFKSLSVRNYYRDALVAAGYEETFDWTTIDSVIRRPHDVQAELAWKELAGVNAAHFLVVIFPAGRGAHIEIGAALGSGKVVFLVGTHDALEGCLFYSHPQVRLIHLPERLLQSSSMVLLEAIRKEFGR